MEYYDPMLYMSTPDHPNTMGVYAALKAPVQGDVLKRVVEDLRERFPYFYVKVKQSGNDLVTVPNPLPMTVRNTWNPIVLQSEEANCHLAAFKFDGKRLALEISHSLTDGAGVLPYFKSILYLYLSRITGESFDRTGFRLPGDLIPETEIGNPFPGLNIEAAEPPMFHKDTVQDFYMLPGQDDADSHVFFLKLPVDQVMKYCKENDGSPNVLFSVLLARSVRRFDPGNSQPVSVGVAVNHKAILGNHDNYRMLTNVAELDFESDRNLDDIMKACTIARGQILLQSQPENSLWAMKQRKMTLERLVQMPLQMKLDVIAKKAGSPRWTANVSYTNSRSFGVLDPYIEELYVMSIPGTAGVLCEIACINGSFFLSFIQCFSSDQYLHAFLDELTAAGIQYERMGDEPLKMCGIGQY